MNLDNLTGKRREIALIMERRKLNILCVQETKWKRSKAKNAGGGCKLFCYDIDGIRNDVGIIRKYVTKVFEVVRMSDRITRIKLEVEV